MSTVSGALVSPSSSVTVRANVRTVGIVTIGEDGRPTERTVASERGDWTAYYANVRDALRGTAPLAVTAEDGRRVVAVLEAATASARTGRPIAI